MCKKKSLKFVAEYTVLIAMLYNRKAAKRMLTSTVVDRKLAEGEFRDKLAAEVRFAVVNTWLKPIQDEFAQFDELTSATSAGCARVTSTHWLLLALYWNGTMRWTYAV